MNHSIQAINRKRRFETARNLIAQTAIDFAADTGTCLFCAKLGDTGTHDNECPVGAYVKLREE